MKKETIQKANELIKQIDNLKTRLSVFQIPLKDGGFDEIHLIPYYSKYDRRIVMMDLFPLKIEDLCLLYETRVIAEIASLEKQLEDLKD
jgi:uncharacterized coiled-coil DUF342 family protein